MKVKLGHLKPDQTIGEMPTLENSRKLRHINNRLIEHFPLPDSQYLAKRPVQHPAQNRSISIEPTNTLRPTSSSVQPSATPDNPARFRNMVGTGVPEFLLKQQPIKKPTFFVRPMRDGFNVSYSKNEELLSAIKNENMLPSDWRIDFRKKGIPA